MTTPALGLINVGLRVFTMAGRLVLLVALARWVEPSAVGVYGLFAATAAWAVYLAGIDFHTYSVRELAGAPGPLWARRLRDTAALELGTLGLAAPVGLLLFALGFLPWSLAGWFLVLLTLELASQELHRVLIGMGRPLAGSTVLFLRGGAWMYGVALAMAVRPELRGLGVVWGAWVVGAAASVAWGGYCLRGLGWSALPAVDWGWIGAGVRQALPFCAATLALRGTGVIERLALEATGGAAAVGVYAFWAQLAGALPVLAESGVFALAYPRLVAAHRQGQRVEFDAALRQLAKGVAAFLVVGVPAAVIAVPLTSRLIRPEYASAVATYAVLVLAAVLTIVAAVPHYFLYARGHDRPIITGALAAFVVGGATTAALVPRLGPLGAALAQCAAMACALAIKAGAAMRAARTSPVG